MLHNKLPQNSMTSENNHLFTCDSVGWQFGLGSALVVLLLVLLMQRPVASCATEAGWSRMASLMSHRYWLLSGEPGSPRHGLSSWLAQAHSHLRVLGVAKRRQTPMCLLTVPWPKASSDFRGGQRDSNSGWKELQSQIAKGHS